MKQPEYLTGRLTILAVLFILVLQTILFSTALYAGTASGPGTLPARAGHSAAVAGPPTSPNLTFSMITNTVLSKDYLSQFVVSAPGTKIIPSSVVVTQPPSDGTFNQGTTGTFTYTPPANFYGTETIQFTATDDASQTSAPVTITINVYAIPVADSYNASVFQKSSVSTDVLSQSKSADGTPDKTSVVVVTAPSHGTTSVNSSTGFVTYTPSPTFYGTDSYQYTFKDNHGVVSNAGTVTIAVDGLPTANNDTDHTFENTTVQTNVVGNDTDPNPGGTVDPGTVVLKSQPAHGSAAASLDGTVVYTPAANYYGTDSYTYQVNDDKGAPSNIATVVITVYAKPPATPITVKTIVGVSVTTDISAQVHPPDGTNNKATVSILSPPSHGVASPSANKDGTVVYSPDAEFFGTDTYSATIMDSNGATSDPVVVTIIVDSPPVITDASVNTPPGVALSTNIVAYTTEKTGQNNIDKTSVRVVANPQHGTAVARADGTVLYTPAAAYVGADTYTVNIKNTSGNVSNTGSVSVLVDVAPVNKGGSIIATTTPSSGTAVNTNILPFVQDPGGSSALDKTSETVDVQAGHGTAVSNGDGTITYTPAAGYYGPDSYSFSIADNLGLRSNTAPVSITVYAQPILKSQNLLAATARPLHINIQAGAFDPTGTLIPGSDSVYSEPGHGVVKLNADGTADYVSDSLYHGPDSFSIVAKDNHGITSLVANFDLVIDLPPHVKDTALLVVAGQPFSYNAALKPAVTDIDGTVDPTSITITQAPLHGTVAVNANGTLVYTSSPQYFGRDSLYYFVKDNLGVSSNTGKVVIATALFSDLAVSLKLNNTNLPDVDGNLSFTVSVTNYGPDKATQVLVTDSLPANLDRGTFQSSSLGQVTVDATGKNLLWKIDSLAKNQSAAFTFQVRVNSGGSISNQVRVTGNQVDLILANNVATLSPVQVAGDDIFIPNIITPNGDGKNDFFVILGTDHYTNAELHVFSRWGSEVYQNTNYKNNWDGGRLLNGTYYYVLSTTNPSGAHLVHKGWVQIQR